MLNTAQQDSMETHTTMLQMVVNDSNTTGVSPVDENYFRWNFAFSVILAAVLSISAFLAVVGNSMVLTVIIRHRGMRTRTNLFLVNLAVADLLVGAAVEPFTITTLIEGRWVFGSTTGTFCKINGWLNCFCLVASIHTLMYISIHKYVSITKPLGNHFKLRQILGMMAAAWVWAAVSSTITVTGLSSVRYKNGTSQCGPEYPSGLKSYIFHIIIQVTNIFIPLIILTFCYTRMFREIRAHSKRLQENSTLEQDIILAQQKRVTITLFIVLACFIICALPYHLYATYTTISINKKFSPYINPVAYSFLYLNSACNPIIYAFRSPAFREGYKEILCQTPTYILSDDATADEAQSPLWHRLSSFFSLRRTSTMSTMVKDQHRSSVCSMNSLVCQGSPVQAVPSGRRQKSISGLIRATRRSTRHSSIIRRNGNIIIVKGGKIVSVRRQESFQANIPVVSELADETTDSAPKTNGCANHISPDLSSESLQGQDSAVWKRRSCSSEGSDSVFDDRCNNLACSSDFACDSPLEMISEEKKLLSQTSEAEQECESSLSTNEVCAPAEKASHVDDNSLAGEGAPCYPNRFKTDVGIIINIDEDDSILDIMPLTPRTRDHIIARSDLFLDDGAKAFSGSLTKLKPAHSSQALSKRSLRRLPSVEYLDPPIGLKKASSDNNVQASTKLQQNVRTLKIPIPNPKRWSFGRKFDKKQAENV